MSPEKNEQKLKAQVDEVFRETVGQSKRGRIKMAAYAVGDQVGILRGLEAENKSDPKDAAHAIKELVKPDTEEIKKAKLALSAAMDGAQAVHNLSGRDIQRALRLAETKFWLFNTEDPTEK